MRHLPLAQILLVAVPLTAQTCSDGTPRITGVSFPDTIPGDGSIHQGELSFTDSDAGVRFAHLENLNCPVDFDCPELSLDLWIDAPEIGEATAGVIGFTMSCGNPTGEIGYIAYLWRLEDIDGRVSEPFSFDYDCVGTAAGRGMPAVSVEVTGAER